jgi:hypothetical protein
MRIAALVIASSLVAVAQQPATPAPPAPQANEWAPVAQALGHTGTVQPDGAYKVGMPRTDLHVTVDDVAIEPAFALGAWLAFIRGEAGADVVGDLVVTEAELDPVMRKLIDAGIHVTAVHNHLLRETPRVMYMHVHGHGDAVQLADQLKDALAELGKPANGAAGNPAPFPSASTPAQAPAAGGHFDAARLNGVMRRDGKMNGDVYQFTAPRSQPITINGHPIPVSAGVATAINFQPAGDKAAVTGDFVLLASEVDPVMRVLRQNNITVTALHSHMLDEQPRLLFMHFWGHDDAIKLARAMRLALDRTASK